MSALDWGLAALFACVAVLYSSVGHAGASGYIAAMALLGVAPETVRPTALALNLLVGGIGLVRFWRAGHVRPRHVLPFVLASAPAAYFAARVPLAPASYATLLGLVLLVAAAGVFAGVRTAPQQDAAIPPDRRVPWAGGLLAGGAIGTLSGLTGTGGAIFLTPLLLFMRWMPTRDASGTSVAFVWINSLTALAGLLQTTGRLPDALPWWLLAVAAGALLGTQLGLRWLPVRALRVALGLVLVVASVKLLMA